MAVADEKDKLAPQLEEARWRNRQLEKDVQQLQDTSNATEQVSVSLQFHSASVIAVSLCLSPSKSLKPPRFHVKLCDAANCMNVLGPVTQTVISLHCDITDSRL